MKNLQTPEDVFNWLGNKNFKEEWSDIPLKVLQRKIRKTDHENFDRQNFLANQTFKLLTEYLKDKNVEIYTAPHHFDSKKQNSKKLLFNRKCEYRISRDFFLITKEPITDQNGNTDCIEDERWEFWVNMPAEKNPIAKRNRAKTHNVKYMKSIFNDVVKLIEGKITLDNLTEAYAKYLKDKNTPSPKRDWLSRNLDKEIKHINETRY